MTPKKEGIAARAAQGDYDLILPLDQKLLEELPPEGTMLGGMYEVGSTVKEIQKKYPMLASGTISVRLRLMREMGLSKQVRLIGGGAGSGRHSWQRTVAADDLLRKLKKEDGNANG